MASAEFYKQPPDEIVKSSERLRILGDQLAAAFARWEEIERKMLE